MNILLVGINFGNYEKKICDEMKKQGHDVYYMFDSHPKQNAFRRGLGAAAAHKINIYYQKKTVRNHDTGLDLVIVIVGRELTADFLDNLKKKNPNARFVLYLWDDVKRVANFESTHLFYDEIFSFDLKDCQIMGFSHLPLFYTESPQKDIKKEYDIYSAMFSHSERENIIIEIAKQAKEQGRKYLFYISLGFFAYYKRRKEINRKRDPMICYISTPIPEAENYRNMEKSKAILDVQFAGQNGLTMRTIESLGMRNKLITTNPNIKYYDFYNDNNIYIIDRTCPELNLDFMKTPYKELEKNLYEKYNLKTWVQVITGEKELPNYIGEYNICSLPFEGQ